MAELWDLFDENKKLLGKTHVRGVPLNKGEYHIIVHIMTVNSKGEILITKRDERKDAGGMWEITGGSKVAGETSLEGASRELFEETGIKAELDELDYCGDYLSECWFHDYYLLKKDIAIEDIIFQEGETVDAKWVSSNELIKIIEDGNFAGSTSSRLRRFYNCIFESAAKTNGIHHVSLKARSKSKLDEAITFYCGVLGCKIEKQWQGGIMINANNCIIEIFAKEEILPDGVIKHFAFETDNVDKCFEESVKAGCEPLVEPNDREIPTALPTKIRMAFVRGVLGEQIEFYTQR